MGTHRRGGPARRWLVALASMSMLGALALATPSLAQDGRAQVEVKKVASPAVIQVGQLARFDITVVNRSTDVTAVNVVLTDSLAEGLVWEWDTTKPECSLDGATGVLTCNIGDLAPGAHWSLSLKVRVTEDCGVIQNTAKIRWKNEPLTPKQGGPGKLFPSMATATILVEGCDVPDDPPPPDDPPDDPVPSGEGCTPGYWKNHEERWDGLGDDDVTTTIKSTDLFNETFGVTSEQSGLHESVTLIGAASIEGGGVLALNRHVAAALANADSISYGMSVADVIALYRDAVDADPGPHTITSAHNLLEAANEQQSCPLNSVP